METPEEFVAASEEEEEKLPKITREQYDEALRLENNSFILAAHRLGLSMSGMNRKRKEFYPPPEGETLGDVAEEHQLGAPGRRR